VLFVPQTTRASEHGDFWLQCKHRHIRRLVLRTVSTVKECNITNLIIIWPVRTQNGCNVSPMPSKSWVIIQWLSVTCMDVSHGLTRSWTDSTLSWYNVGYSCVEIRHVTKDSTPRAYNIAISIDVYMTGPVVTPSEWKHTRKTPLFLVPIIISSRFATKLDRRIF